MAQKTNINWRGNNAHSTHIPSIEANVVPLYIRSNWTHSEAKAKWIFTHTHKHTRIQARISIVRKIGYYMFHVYLFVFKSLLCIYEISICTHSISKSTAEIEKKHTTIKMTVFLLQRIHVLYIMFIKFLRWRVYLPVKSSMQSIPCRFYIFFIRSNASTISTALKFRINRDRGVFNAICYCSCLLCKTDEQHSIVVCVCVSYLCIWLSISVYLELFMSFSRSKSSKQLIPYTFGKNSFSFSNHGFDWIS